MNHHIQGQTETSGLGCTFICRAIFLPSSGFVVVSKTGCYCVNLKGGLEFSMHSRLSFHAETHLLTPVKCWDLRLTTPYPPTLVLRRNLQGPSCLGCTARLQMHMAMPSFYGVLRIKLGSSCLHSSSLHLPPKKQKQKPHRSYLF